MKRTVFGLIFSLFLAFPVTAPAQTISPAQADAAEAIAREGAPSAAELQDLIRTLRNDAERAKLISRLNAMLAAKGESKSEAPEKSIGNRVLDLISSRIDRISTEFVAGTRAIMDLPNVYDWVARQLSDGDLRAWWVEIAWKLLAAVAVGLIGEALTRRLLAPPRRTLETKSTDTLWVKTASLLARTVLDVIPIAVLLAASYAVLFLIQPGDVTRMVALSLINAFVLARVVLAIGRLIFAPAAATLRLVPLRNADAIYLFIWVRRLANVSIYGYFAILAMGPVGLTEDGADVLLKILGLIIALMLIMFTRQNQKPVAAWLRGEGKSDIALKVMRTRIADLWHVLVILYVAVMYGVWALSVENGFEFVLQATAITLIISVAARLATAGFKRAARRVFALSDDVRRRNPGLEARANRYLPMLENAAAAIIGVVAIFAVLEAWGIDAFSWLATPFGQRATSSVITIALLLVFSVIILEAASAAIERYLGRAGTDVSARARTLLPLLRTTLLVVLATLFVLVTLSELGLNIAPLLAGAGVVGLAVGFGAQTLVKDIITGLFILMEDQLAVGDVVKVGSHAGLVEKLTLRTIRLRDLAGTVHIVPFSEVTTLENLTKEFSRYVFNVGVAYREDTDEVVAVLRQLGDEMIQDEDYKDLILQPLEILGVDSFDDNAVVIKARITTKPIKQWTVGREFNRRMKKRFDELGIEIPFPHRTIYFGEDKRGDAPAGRIAMVKGKARKAPAQGGAATASERASAAETPDTGGADAPDGE